MIKLANNLARQPAAPSVALVKEYLRKWDTLEKYRLQEASLALLFRQLCPRHDDILHVLLKVSTLNDFYSTNIFDTHSVAKHILTIGVNDRIADGDATLVNRLALVEIGGKKWNFYSFASKYCNHHNAEAFPIYDSYVDKMLIHFQRPLFELPTPRSQGVPAVRRTDSCVQEGLCADEFSLRQIDTTSGSPEKMLSHAPTWRLAWDWGEAGMNEAAGVVPMSCGRPQRLFTPQFR